MNIVYVNLSPQKISNEQIHSFLSELADILKTGSDFFIKNAEDLFPGVNSYFKKILSFYCVEGREGINGIVGFLKVLNSYPSFDSLKKEKPYLGEDEAIYGILEYGYKKQISFKNSKIVLLSGKKYRVPFPYGVACENVCINCCLEKYSIWHETAHLFGASDHYDENSHLTTCGDEKCFMQWDSLKGEHFCSKAISEIGIFMAQ